jgi:hypothetical protein
MAATRAGTSNNSYDHSDDDSILENDLMDTDDGVPSVLLFFPGALSSKMSCLLKWWNICSH